MDKEPPTSTNTRSFPALHLDLAASTTDIAARSRGRSFTQALPSLRISTSPTSTTPPPISPLGDVPNTVNKARGELRKLLSHLLSRLKARPRPPSVYDGLRADSVKKDPHRLGVVVDTVRSAVRFRSAKEPPDAYSVDQIGEESTVENVQDFSTDATYNYMIQLRDVLIMSDNQGWRILHVTDAEAAISSQRESSSLRRLRRSSPHFNQRSRSPSSDGSFRPPDLLLECIDILGSVISEDCRYKTSSSRLMRPPYGLQAACLDVAQILIKTHRHDAKILSQIGSAVIPGFFSFDCVLHTRLLTFFEDGILRRMLEDLRSWQGLDISPVKESVKDHTAEIKAPIVAIQVDEATDDPFVVSGQQKQQGWLQWSSTSTPTGPNFLSTVAPSQPLVVYHLSSLIPPLLAAVLEAIDPLEEVKDVQRLYRLYTLLQAIVSMKQDAYLDMLEIVAYHGTVARRRALAVLATFWPKALGHIVIGKALPVTSYSDALSTWSPSSRFSRIPTLGRDHQYAHEFMPWRFFSPVDSSSPDYGVLRNSCHACSNPIVGFGLICPFCFLSIHLNCYDTPSGTFHGQYILPMESDPRPYFLSFSDILASRRDVQPEIIRKSEHAFRSANLFTLSLCLACHKPLWGYVTQGMRCLQCHQFVHTYCASGTFNHCKESSPTPGHVIIDWSILRQTFVDHYRQILFSEEEVSNKTYEEISIYYSVLWVQLRIFDSGVSYRSIIINQKDPKTAPAKENYVDGFELQYFVRLYEAYLSSGRLVASASLQEYHDFNKHAYSNEHSVLFDWSLLTTITSVIRSPTHFHTTSLSTSSNLLHVADHEITGSPEATSHPFELVVLSHMRNVLGHEFQIHSDHAARYLLSQIRHLGFFDRVDANSGLFDAPSPSPSEVLCAFPLPLGLDLSTSVETMVVAIEACLQDIDIAINEHGFLLLVRRFAPTGAASEYALTRLTKIVLSWILAEDDRLVIIARDHVAHNLNLPGVRTTSDPLPWPSSSTGRYTTKTAVNSGGEYVLCRKQLLARHAVPWLASVHALDATLYMNVLYDHCVDMAESSDSGIVAKSLYSSKTDADLDMGSRLACGDATLRSIVKLAQVSVTFSGFESILVRWFDFVTSPGTKNDLTFRSLPRLFTHEADPSRRTSVLTDAPFSLPDSIHIDPWKVFIDIAAQDTGGLERSLLWLRVMTHSAVDIPSQILKKLFDLARDCRAPFITMVSLLESTMVSTWLKTYGSDGLDNVIMEINLIWADDLLFRMQSDDEVDEILKFLRHSLVICLLVYGCERQAITSLGLISSDSLRSMPQRRKTSRRSAAPAILEINPQLVTLLSRYVAQGPERVCAIIAKFLNTLVSESALLEAHEIDHFILVNGDALAQCAWRFYDIDSQEISDIRTSFLLRLLVVDPQPLDALLCGFLKPDGKWQVRFQAVARLFRILLDVNSPSFGVRDRQWKTGVTDIINHFFQALWLDDCEEIRLAIDTWARTLLPAHRQIISTCWNEYMNKAPVADRARLASFLVQLHPHFPSWQVLSWETIVECLLDDDFVQNNGADEDGYAAAAHLSIYGYPSSKGREERPLHQDDPELVALRVSLVILSLQFIANRVEVDMVNLIKIKLILAKVFGFTNTNLEPAANGQAFYVEFNEIREMHEISFSCVNPLMRVLDAPHKLAVTPSSMGATWNEIPVPGLVGDMFVDIAAKLWNNVSMVQGLPYPVVRGLLESMILIIVKHELISPSLKHLDEVMCKAVKSVTDLITLDSSYDIRHLCLAVMLAFMQGYPALALRILGHQVLVLTRLAASLRFNIEDSLILRAREFLEIAFIQYEVSGLFWLLSKQGRMSNDLFTMLRYVVNSPSAQTAIRGEGLRDSIVRDTLSKVAASAGDRAIPDVLHNLERYVAICHHQSYSASLIQHIGLRLTAIARQTADLAVSTSNRSMTRFDPNPLLLMSASIVQHNKSHSIDLLLHTETLLRAALVRFDVYLNTLERLLHVTSTMYRRSKTVDLNGAEVPTNHIAMGILDILSDTLKGKVRALPSTLAAMLEVVMSLHNDQNAYLPTLAVLRAGTDAISYLSYPLYRENYAQAEFVASIAVAKLILHASACADGFLQQQSLVGDIRSPTTVRVWNLIALAGLKDADATPAQRLLVLLPAFVVVYVTSLRLPSSGALNESVAPAVNHAFASIKLWMLIARKACAHGNRLGNTEQDTSDSDSAERMIWNELWPPFERLLVQSLADSPNGETPPLLSFVWGCVSDLILFLRQASSVIALDTSSHVSILNKLRSSRRGEAAGGKFTRAQRSISEPPMDVSFEILVSQVSNDVFTAEKLQARRV